MSRLSYKFRLYPNREQTTNLERSLDLCRDLYNGAVQERKEAWKLNRVHISLFSQSGQIPDIRKLNADYMQIQSRVCYRVLRQVDTSFQAFFRRVKAGENPGFPRFKGKAFFNSFFYNREGFKFVDGKLRLANIGLVKIRQHREIKGTIKEITIKREGLKWFAIVSCDHVPDRPLPVTHQVIGLDAGIESFVTLSDGSQIDNPRHYQSTQKKLRVTQRRVARRKKGSNGRKKAVAQLRNVYGKVFRQRDDFQHKASRHLVNNYDLIAVEDLNVKGLSRGILSKQVHDVSWSSFFDKLVYKAENADRQLIKVNPAFTSQDCSGCGNRLKKDLSIREHNCLVCGLVLHRDENAARNILRLGLSLADLTYRNTESVSAAA